MTAYRQQALACATALRAGPLRPRDLRAVAPDAGRILLRNVYGWFERVEPGLYRLAERGASALHHWTQVGDGHLSGAGAWASVGDIGQAADRSAAHPWRS